MVDYAKEITCSKCGKAYVVGKMAHIKSKDGAVHSKCCGVPASVKKVIVNAINEMTVTSGCIWDCALQEV